MSGILSAILLVVGIFFTLVGIYFLFRALDSRLSASNRSYGVARQEARQSTLVNITRGIIFLALALISFAVMVLFPSPDLKEPEITLVSTLSPAPTLTAAATLTSVNTAAAETRTATISIPSRTPFPTDTPEPTSIPILPSALVSSPNGLWLRESPGGIQEVELLPDGAVLILQPGLETVDGSEWQEVRTRLGNIGWVAVEFIEFQQ